MLSLPKVLILSESEVVSNTLIGEIEVRPEEQVRMSLGGYDKPTIPSIFFVKASPNPQDDAIVAQVTCIEPRKDHYELTIHIANYGNKTVCAEVRRLQ